MDYFCHINVFNVNFDKLNASLLNKSITFLKKKQKTKTLNIVRNFCKGYIYEQNCIMDFIFHNIFCWSVVCFPMYMCQFQLNVFYIVGQ